MPAVTSNSESVRQTELIFRRVESLPVLPGAVVRFFNEMTLAGNDVSNLKDIVESDPALAAKMYSLAYEHNIDSSNLNDVLAKLPRWLIRDGILSLDVYSEEDKAFGGDTKKLLPRRELIRHSLAVACCGREIAKNSSKNIDANLAYMAGLLVNIGKIAIDSQMPKSYEKIIAEANSHKTSLASAEINHFGADNSFVAKRLAEKWHLPKDVILAVWLYRNEAYAISQYVESGLLALVLRLADLIVRREKIGNSGEAYLNDGIDELAVNLGIDPQGLEKIKNDFQIEFQRRSELSGLNSSIGMREYCQCMRKMTSVLARSNSVLQEKNRQLSIETFNNELNAEFIEKLPSYNTPTDAAACFAGLFQKTFKTGPVCLLTFDKLGGGYLDGVLVGAGQSSPLLVKADENIKLLQGIISDSCAVKQVDDSWGWFFSQTPVDFDLSRTYYAPVRCKNKLVGIIIFSLSRLDMELCGAEFKEAASMAGSVISLLSMQNEHRELAEKFASVLSQYKKMHDHIAESRSFGGIAEMAAGAAHELNNPLSVISGRAQLMLQIEDDESKKKMLKQVQERTDEISRIVTDLMSFAKPHNPTLRSIDVHTILNSAINQALHSCGLKEIEVTFDSIDNLPKINVDTQQIVNAVSNIIVNALDSYPENIGPVFISGKASPSSAWVEITISDNGCGMDEQTRVNAAKPFYSLKKAGRKRGMGLSHSKRLIELNSGSIYTQSQLGEGTKVTVRLPMS